MAGPALDIEEVLRRYSQIFGSGEAQQSNPLVSPGARFRPDLQQPLIPSTPGPLQPLFQDQSPTLTHDLPPQTVNFWDDLKAQTARDTTSPGFFDWLGQAAINPSGPEGQQAGQSFRNAGEAALKFGRGLGEAMGPPFSTPKPAPVGPAPSFKDTRPQFKPVIPPNLPGPVKPGLVPSKSLGEPYVPPPSNPWMRYQSPTPEPFANRAFGPELPPGGFQPPPPIPSFQPEPKGTGGSMSPPSTTPDMTPKGFGFNLNLSTFDPGPAKESQDKPAYVAASTPDFSTEDARDREYEEQTRRMTMIRNLTNAGGTFLNNVLKGSRIRAGIPIGSDLNEPPPNPLDDEIARRQDKMTYGERGMIGKVTGNVPPPGTSLSRFQTIRPLIQESLQARERAAAESRRRGEREEDIARSEKFRKSEREERQGYVTGEREERRQDRRAENLGKAVSGVQQNKKVQSLVQNQIAATQAMAGIESGTSLGERGVGYQLVRLAGDRGQLARSDIAAFAARAGFPGIADRIYMLATGRASEKFKGEVKQLVAVYLKASEEALDQELHRLAKTHSNQKLGAPEGADENEIYELLKGEAIQTHGQLPDEGGGTEGGVWIRNPVTGEVQNVAPEFLDLYVGKGGWVRDK